MDAVHRAIDRRDCERAGTRLNEGLAARHPGVYLMAGAMYEDGVCLKANWERASLMYQRAHEAGHTGGVLRLVAGNALGRRDVAAALWWAQQADRLPKPAACQVGESVWKDPDQFVATLQRWPREQLDACLYVVGVMAMIVGDVEYPAQALRYELEGQVRMRFDAPAGRIDWQTLGIEPGQMRGVLTGESQAQQRSRSVVGSLESNLRSIGERALARYPKPPEVPEHWRFTQDFNFTINRR